MWLSSQQVAVSTHSPHTEAAGLYGKHGIAVCACAHPSCWDAAALVLLLLFPNPAGVTGSTTTDATTPDISHAANKTLNDTSAAAASMAGNHTAGEPSTLCDTLRCCRRCWCILASDSGSASLCHGWSQSLLVGAPPSRHWPGPPPRKANLQTHTT